MTKSAGYETSKGRDGALGSDLQGRIRDRVREMGRLRVIETNRSGWIDGQKRPLDEVSFLRRLTPRKPGSSWSAKNREHVTRLIEERLVMPAGLARVEAARADGRWASACDGQAAMVIPQDFVDPLESRPVAKAFLGRSTAKPLLCLLPAPDGQARDAGKTHGPNARPAWRERALPLIVA